ncbi:hypothetical protein ACHAXS_008587 [Conticribra weissflogii]
MPQKLTLGEDEHFNELDCNGEDETKTEDGIQESAEDGVDDGWNEDEDEDESEGDEDEDEDEGDEWNGSEEDEEDDIEDKEEDNHDSENPDEEFAGALSEEENKHEKGAGPAEKNGNRTEADVRGGEEDADDGEEESSQPSLSKHSSPDLPDSKPAAIAKSIRDAGDKNIVAVEVISLDVAPKKNEEGHSSVSQKKRPGPINTWQEKLDENDVGKRKRSQSRPDRDSSPARLKDPPELVVTSDTNGKNQAKTAKGGRKSTQRKANAVQANGSGTTNKPSHSASLPTADTMQKFAQLSQADAQARYTESLRFPHTNSFFANQTNHFTGLWYPNCSNIPPQFYPYQMTHATQAITHQNQTTQPLQMKPIPLSSTYICTPLIPNDICAPYRMAYFRVMERKRQEEQEKRKKKGVAEEKGVQRKKKTQTTDEAQLAPEEKVVPGMMC